MAPRYRKATASAGQSAVGSLSFRQKEIVELRHALALEDGDPVTAIIEAPEIIVAEYPATPSERRAW
jgi:hypothetical protein